MTMAHTGGQTWQHPVSQTKAYWLPSTIILSLVFVTFRPFGMSGSVAGHGSGGDFVNQLGFGLIGIACGFILFKHTPSKVLGAFLNPAWILVFFVLMFSIYNADYPPGAFRAMLFSIIVVVAALTALSLPRNMTDMVSVLGWTTLTTLIFCLIAVVVFPSHGVHGSGGFESQHAGLWRGVYDHKNIASYVMGVFVMIGLFVWRNGRRGLGMAVTIIATIFVIKAGSKTVLGILPIAIFAALTARWVTFGLFRFLIIFIPVFGLGMATLGGIIHPPILEALQEAIPGLTYTGRVDLWKFGMGFVDESPWFGYGFESFWATPRVEGMEQPIELSWDIRGIVHGHNSWMDGAIAFGVLGMVLITIVIGFMPILDFMKIPDTGNAAKLATLFISIWIFTAMGASLESFFFRRSDPVWFCMLIAVIGLRITAHMCASNRYR